MLNFDEANKTHHPHIRKESTMTMDDFIKDFMRLKRYGYEIFQIIKPSE